MKIVTGGQTGVDRAALDAALQCGAAAGGWCPEGRKAEDGRIADYYPVQALANAGYHERTRKNVEDSDASLIIYFGLPTGGTELTLLSCVECEKPYVLIDAEKLEIDRAVEKVRSFIEIGSIRTLNVAGPRASEEAKAYPFARKLISELLKFIY